MDTEDHVVLERFKPLHLILNTPKGRGVRTPDAIASGTIIDINPVLLLSPSENTSHISQTVLYHYTYNWPISCCSSDDDDRERGHRSTTTTQAIVFGLGSLFNHSTANQNVGWTRDLQRQVIVYRALRDIVAGEELCISYGAKLTFVDADEKEGKGDEGEVEEKGEEMLGKIVLDDGKDGES